MAGRTEFLQILSETNGASLDEALPESLSVNDMGPYPLARDVGFPDSDEQGELMLGIEGITVYDLAVSGAAVDPDRARVTISFAPSSLAGRYEVYGIEQPAIDLDIGGGLMPLAMLAEGTEDSSGGTDSDQPMLTEAQYNQLMLANDQKPRLSKTKQGRELLKNYATYNDDYNYVFQTNAGLRQFWPADGATAAMADQTSSAVTNNTVVNPPDTTFGASKLTYNGNSFSQAIHLVVACNAAKKADAAVAVSGFMKGVTDNTGNSSTTTKPMTPDEVYAAVDNAPDTSLLAADDSGTQVLAAVHNIANDTHDDTHLELLASVGCEPDDEMIRRIQTIHAHGVARSQPPTRYDLWTGALTQNLPAIDMLFELEDEPDGHVTCRLLASSLAIETLDVDASGWVDANGGATTAGQIAQDRITGARFLHGLMQDRINTAIKQAVERIVEEQTG